MQLEEDLTEKVIAFVMSNYYKSWKPYLLKLLSISRAKRYQRSIIHGIVLQNTILKSLVDLEKIIKEQQKIHGFNKTDSNVIYNLRLRQVLKDIADGYAWRILGFNRPLMRLLSQNKSTGHIDTEFSMEDVVASNISMDGWHVLINDITNILRIGDLIIMEPGGIPQVVELKSAGKKIWTYEEYQRRIKKGGTLSDQGSKILELNEAIRTGYISIGANTANLAQVDFDIDTYLTSVQEVITKCQTNESGFSERHIDKVLFVRAIHLPSLSKVVTFPFKQKTDWMNFSSLDTLHMKNAEVFRNKMPYSVYPLADNDVIQLLSGEIILESFIDFIALTKEFKKFGWKVKKRIFDDLDYEETRENTFKGNRLFQDEIDTTMFTLSKDGFNLEVNAEFIGMIYHDFIKPRFISDMAMFLMSISKENRTDGYWSIGNIREKSIWK